MDIGEAVELEKRKSDLVIAQEHQKALYQAYNVSGTAAAQIAMTLMRAAFLLNAGALFAAFILFGRLISSTKKGDAYVTADMMSSLDSILSMPVSLFLIGIGASAIGAGCAYGFQLRTTVLFQEWAEKASNSDANERLEGKDKKRQYFLPSTLGRKSLLAIAILALIAAYVLFIAGVVVGANIIQEVV